MNFDNIDFNLYKVFLVVAKMKSISQASKVLYVSQPAVSYNIKTLEEKIGCKLFKRNAKGVELTADAEKLLFYVESAYGMMETGFRMLNDSTDLLSGQIRIGVPTHIGTFFLAQYIQKFTQQYPGIKFFIVNKSTDEMMQMLEKRELDVIIDTYPIYSYRKDVVTTDLIELDNCFVGNKKYKELAYLKKNKIEDLQKYSLLLQPYRTSTRQLLEEALKGRVKKLEPLIEVPTTEVMLDLVKRGVGIGYFAKPSVINDIKDGKLYEILVDIDLPKNKIGMVYIEDCLTSATRHFCEMIKQDVKESIQRKNKALRIVLTQDCIYNCNFCHKEGINERREKLLNSDIIEKIYLAANEKLGITRVTLTGGEPLTNADIYEIVEKLKENGAKVTITTNGYFLDKYLKIGKIVDKINISLHTIDKTVFDQICQKEGACEQVKKNIKMLRAEYPTLKIGINMTLIKKINDNKESIEKMVKFINSVKVDLKIIELFPRESEGFVDINTIKPELKKNGFELKKREFRKQIYSNGKQNIILCYCTCTSVSNKQDKVKECKENNDIFITPDGKISLCRYSNKEIDLMEAINKNDIIEIESKLEEACSLLGNECKC